MKIIEPSYEILTPISEGGTLELKKIEKIGRICYKSEERITEDGESAKKFVKNLIDRGHEAMIEHSSLSVLFICDRGVSHELVRHRLCSFAQESTRYCNYGNGQKHPEGLTFIRPCFYEEGSNEYNEWVRACLDTEFWYLQAIKRGAKPQEARTVLSNSVKTEIVVTTNYREWRNVLDLRCSNAAHPQIRQLMLPLLDDLHDKLPIIFDDLHKKIQPP